MQYFKNTELANTYHVSVRAVSNWVAAAKQGRLDLDLHTQNGREYVANTARNISSIKKLVEERRKYRTSKAHKVVTPSREFYKLFSPEQVVDIISNLEVQREIPRQYSYFDGGATRWDHYATRLYSEEDSNLLKGTIKLLDTSRDFLNAYFSNYEQVNVVDIGPGNCLPVKKLLNNLYDSNLLGSYTAVDISPDMIAIAEKNITEWFGGKLDFRGEIRDVTYERFSDILAVDYFKFNGRAMNLVLFLGGTLDNFRDQQEALKAIRHSMGSHDLLVYSTKLDTPASRSYFDFNNKPGNKLSPNHRLIVDLMNIDESQYEVESGFEASKSMRFIRLRLKVALTIEFKGTKGVWPVDLNKNDTILIWRAWDYTPGEIQTQFDLAGFELLQTAVTPDRENFLSINGLKRISDN